MSRLKEVETNNIYCSLQATVCNLDYVASNIWAIMDDEWERMWKESWPNLTL
jgi:hypothetical protein